MSKENKIETYWDKSAEAIRVRLNGSDLNGVISVERRQKVGGAVTIRLELFGDAQEVDWLPAPDEDLPF